MIILSLNLPFAFDSTALIEAKDELELGRSVNRENQTEEFD